MASDKTFRSYRLSPETIRKLDDLAERLTLDKTTCIEAGISLLHDSLRVPTPRRGKLAIDQSRKIPS